METKPIVIERMLDAPADQVWEAITDNNKLKKWYFNLESFIPKVGFEFEFTVENNGKKFRHLCRVTDVVPGKKISYSWRYDKQPGNSVVTFELFPEGNRTKLVLTHEGVHTFPQDADFARGNFVQGWTEITKTLKEFVEKE